jgi:hypothetical protein
MSLEFYEKWSSFICCGRWNCVGFYIFLVCFHLETLWELCRILHTPGMISWFWILERVLERVLDPYFPRPQRFWIPFSKTPKIRTVWPSTIIRWLRSTWKVARDLSYSCAICLRTIRARAVRDSCIFVRSSCAQCFYWYRVRTPAFSMRSFRRSRIRFPGLIVCVWPVRSLAYVTIWTFLAVIDFTFENTVCHRVWIRVDVTNSNLSNAMVSGLSGPV